MFAVTPDWNGYTGYARLIQAAWDALVDLEPYELQSKALAEAAGVSRSLHHKHFQNPTVLLTEVVAAGYATLLLNLKEEETFDTFAGSWIRFAGARPRHYGLMFSAQFADHPKVNMRINELCIYIRTRGETHLGITPSKPQIQTLFGIIHGAASLVAAGFPRQSNQALLEPLEAYLTQLKR